MKPIPALLLNVVTIAAALLLYDHFRGDDDGRGPDRASSARSGVGDSIGMEERLRRIETRLAAIPDAPPPAREPQPRAPDVPEDRPAPERAAAPRDVDVPQAPPEALTESEIARFRQVREAVEREDAIRKNRERIDRQLDRSGVSLTPAQREKIHAAWANFEPRVQAIWTGIKAEAMKTVNAGGQVDSRALREQGIAQIQSEFAASLGEIVNHPADADAIAAALNERAAK